MHHRHPFFKKLCVTAACAAAVVPVFAEAAAYQYRANLQGLVVSGPGPSLDNLSVALATSQLPDAIVGVPYSANLNQLLSVTGDAAYSGEGVSWGVVSNSLPAGLYLTVDGYIGGTPTATGTGDIQVRASYKTAQGEQTYQVVSLPLTVALTSATLPAATVGSPYSYDFKSLVSSNDPTFTGAQASFSATGLPSGLSLAADGTISGAPTVKNEAGASFQVVASYKTKTGQQAYTIVVNGAVLQVTQISAGRHHACAVTESGGLKCWGSDQFGQLGNDTAKVNQPQPVDVAGLTSGVVSVSAGSQHTCAVTTLGSVKCWGRDDAGQLGDDSVLANQPMPVNVSGLTSGIAMVASGGSHSCAVTVGGAVMCWGSDSDGQLGNDASIANKATPVSVLGLTSGVSFVAAGYAHTCALTSGGGVKCWGNDANGELGNDTNKIDQMTPVSVYGLALGVGALSTGHAHNCIVMTSGGAKCWGFDGNGELGNDTAVSTQPIPVAVAGLSTGVLSISSGYNHTCAVTTSGGAKCWGANTYGQLGNGASTTSKPTPSDVLDLNTAYVSVSVGDGYSCAITASGKAKCWGRDDIGQLGNDAELAKQPTPVDVSP